MSSPCAGGARGHGARPRSRRWRLLCLSRKGSASPRSCDCPKQLPREGFATIVPDLGGFVRPLRGVSMPCGAVWMRLGVCARSGKRRRCPEPAQVFFIPSTKAHSLLSQIRMKRFPFQLLPPSLRVYLSPRPRGFSANKLPSFQVAFPFSHCSWQPAHVKLR